VAILVGSIFISLAVLVSGKVISLEDFNLRGSLEKKAVETKTQPAEVKTEAKVALVSAKDHLRGDKNARIVLIEYSDLECPFCKSFHSTAKEAVSFYKGNLSWVYRHFPLDSLHSKARKEAESTECANELGGEDAFWKMVDKIYEVTPSNNGLDLTILPDLAVQVGLDRNKFESCLQSGKFASVVEADYQSGLEAGVKGTPGNFLMDTKTGETVVLPGAVPLSNVKQEVDLLLKL